MFTKNVMWLKVTERRKGWDTFSVLSYKCVDSVSVVCVDCSSDCSVLMHNVAQLVA